MPTLEPSNDGVNTPPRDEQSAEKTHLRCEAACPPGHPHVPCVRPFKHDGEHSAEPRWVDLFGAAPNFLGFDDCACRQPTHDGRGNCSRCGDFACEYADRGQTRCPTWRCDCFIEQYPDSPRDLHPEAFTVGPTAEVDHG